MTSSLHMPFRYTSRWLGMHMRHAIRVPQTTSKHTRTPPDVPRSHPKPIITNGERFVTSMHSCLTYVMLCISGKYLVQQMQLEVKMQARAVLGGYPMAIGRVWVGLLRLIHLHVHSAIPPHIPADADRRTQLPNAPAEPEPISDIALPSICTGPGPLFKTH